MKKILITFQGHYTEEGRIDHSDNILYLSELDIYSFNEKRILEQLEIASKTNEEKILKIIVNYEFNYIVLWALIRLLKNHYHVYLYINDNKKVRYEILSNMINNNIQIDIVDKFNDYYKYAINFIKRLFFNTDENIDIIINKSEKGIYNLENTNMEFDKIKIPHYKKEIYTYGKINNIFDNFGKVKISDILK